MLPLWNACNMVNRCDFAKHPYNAFMGTFGIRGSFLAAVFVYSATSKGVVALGVWHQPCWYRKRQNPSTDTMRRAKRCTCFPEIVRFSGLTPTSHNGNRWTP